MFETPEFATKTATEIVLERGKLVGVLPYIGKEFSIRFEMDLSSLEFQREAGKPETDWQGILHLTQGGNIARDGKPGKRIPALWLLGDTKYTPAMDIGGKTNAHSYGPEGRSAPSTKFQLKTGVTKVEMSQKQADGKVI